MSLILKLQGLEQVFLSRHGFLNFNPQSCELVLFQDIKFPQSRLELLFRIDPIRFSLDVWRKWATVRYARKAGKRVTIITPSSRIINHNFYD
jgi:hypothetical protein